MSPVRLRAGTIADAVAIYQLDLVCFEPPFRFDLRTMRRFVASRQAIAVVAEDGALVVGAVILEISHRPGFSSAYIVTLDVRPEHRREGVARALMQEAERRAVEVGVNHVRLHVYAGNEGAILLYEGFGYKRITSMADFYGVGLDAFLYGKRIAPPS